MSELSFVFQRFREAMHARIPFDARTCRIGGLPRSLISSRNRIARPQVCSELNKPYLNGSKWLADYLLEKYADQLTSEEEATCLLHKYEAHWDYDFDIILKRIVKEPELAQSLMRIGINAKSPGKISLLALATNAIITNKNWGDLLWELFANDCNFSGHSETEHAGIALLRFGIENKKYACGIGTAAQKVLSDSRFQKNRRDENFHWLGLLADEFIKLPPEIISQIICHNSPGDYGAATALIARLGKVPRYFICRKDCFCQYSQENLLTQENADILVDKLCDYGKDSNTLHPELFATLKNILFISPLSEPAITKIAQSGSPGLLISMLLRFVYTGDFYSSKSICLVTSNYLFRDSNWDKLRNIWSISHRNLLLEDNEERKVYLTTLHEA